MVKGKRFFNKCYIVAVGSEKGWSPSLISKRINSNGGHHQSKITKDTTHLVATYNAWKKQGGLIKEALAINDDIDNKRKSKHKQKIHIVSFTWLDDSWLAEKAKGEQPFKWEIILPKVMQNGEDADDEDTPDEESGDNEPARTQKKPNGKAAVNGKASAQNLQAVEEPRSHKGMMAQVFEESTNQYVNAKEAAAIKKKQENERRIAEELAEEERKEKEAKKAAAAFKKGAKKCRNEIFSENHHIYADETGFKYDVLLTKVDTRHNKNQRWALTLQIYESNAEPYTYAFNAQFAGTDTRPANNVITPLGSSIFVALHAFKTAFKERAGVDWDSRISHALERAKREKRNRGQGTGSDHGTQRGIPISEPAAANSRAEAQENFETAPFQYHPPQYGARGELSEEEKARLKESEPAESSQPAASGKAKERAVDHDKVSQWINGASSAERASDFEMMGSVLNGVGLGEDRELTNDLDKIFYGGLPGRATNVDSPEAIDLDDDDAFGFPFETDNLDWTDVPTDANESRDLFYNHNNVGVPDSFDVGTQQIGETQLAEKANGELMELINKPTDQHDHTDIAVAAGDIETDKPADGLEQNTKTTSPFAIDASTLDLGSSILGKRKGSQATDSQESKKAKLAEVPDSFEESPAIDPSDSRAEEKVPRLLMEELVEYAEDSANEQLLGEMAAGESVPVD